MDEPAHSVAEVFSRLNSEFFPTYALVARKLRDAFAMRDTLKDGHLHATHRGWVVAQKEKLERCRTRADRANAANDFLPTLAVALCESDCIAYRPERRLEAWKGEFQDMLAQFPDILTALQFVRDEHIRIWATKMGYSTSSTFTFQLTKPLRQAVLLIRNDPREAANYATHLALPDLDLGA